MRTRSIHPSRILFAILLLATLLTSCEFGKSQGKGDSTPATPAVVPLVRAERPTKRDLERFLEITGEVVPTLEAEVASKLGALPVHQILSDIGAHVDLDQVLAILEDTEPKQQRSEARLSAVAAEVKVREAACSVAELQGELLAQKISISRRQKLLERTKAQAERGAVAEEDLDSATYELDKERAVADRLKLQIEKAKVIAETAAKEHERALLLLERSETDLKNVDVKAPFKGIVSERTVSLGQIAAAGQRLFRLFDPKSLVVETFVPQRELLSISKSQIVRLKSDAYQGITFLGTVAQISPTVEETNGTIRVRIKIDSEATLAAPLNEALLARPECAALKEELSRGEPMKPGLFVSGRIVLGTKKDALTVPRKAIGYQNGRPFLFVLEGGEGTGSAALVRRVYFEEGLTADGAVEFLAMDQKRALAPTDQVIIVGGERLKDGDEVRLATTAIDADAKAPESPSEAGND